MEEDAQREDLPDGKAGFSTSIHVNEPISCVLYIAFDIFLPVFSEHFLFRLPVISATDIR